MDKRFLGGIFVLLLCGIAFALRFSGGDQYNLVVQIEEELRPSPERLELHGDEILDCGMNAEVKDGRYYIKRAVGLNVGVENAGIGDFDVGAPNCDPLCKPGCGTNCGATDKCSNDNWYCDFAHGHPHIRDLVVYRLVDTNGVPVGATSRKMGFNPGRCSSDADRWNIKPGCIDWYRFKTPDEGSQRPPCQFIDATNVPPGRYIVQAEVDPTNRYKEESNEKDNIFPDLATASPETLNKYSITIGGQCVPGSPECFPVTVEFSAKHDARVRKPLTVYLQDQDGNSDAIACSSCSVAGTVCTAYFVKGTRVIMKMDDVKPAPGDGIELGWTGACSASGRRCELDVRGAALTTAWSLVEESAEEVVACE